MYGDPLLYQLVEANFGLLSSTASGGGVLVAHGGVIFGAVVAGR
jgi:hypothetical protein